MEADWAERRREAAQTHEAHLKAAQAAESAKAQVLIADFVARVQALGIAPERLVAEGYTRGVYKTDIVGWYLRANRSLGVDAAGRYYVLRVPGGLVAKLRGVKLAPSDPPLTVGRGGRDGEAMDLRDLVEIRLAELARTAGEA
jgi:hypothetical protein